MASYPKLEPETEYATEKQNKEEDEDAYVPAWIVETNNQRHVLHAQLQQQLYHVLQTSFGEHEKEIFSKFAIFQDMTVVDDQ